MAIGSSSSHYGRGVRAFHWLTVILVLATYGLSKGDSYSLYSSAADGIRRSHETLGIVILVVVVMQLLWRLIGSRPDQHPMPRWMAVAARLVRFALYMLLTAIPATAIVGTWLLGLPVTLLGFDIGPQIAEAHGLGQMIMEIHTTLGNAIIWLAGAHAAAAFFHCFYLRDKVLQSMAWGG